MFGMESKSRALKYFVAQCNMTYQNFYDYASDHVSNWFDKFFFGKTGTCGNTVFWAIRVPQTHLSHVVKPGIYYIDIIVQFSHLPWKFVNKNRYGHWRTVRVAWPSASCLIQRSCYGMNCRPAWIVAGDNSCRCSRHKSSPATIHADVRGMNFRRHKLSTAWIVARRQFMLMFAA